MIARMVGWEVGDIFPTVDHAHGEVVFEVENVGGRSRRFREKAGGTLVSLYVRGEVLGIAGLMGPGEAIC